ALTADYLLAQGVDRITPTSPHSVSIPGAIDAWIRLHEKCGRMDFSDLLAPAIDYAENGFPVTQRTSVDWQLAVPKIEKNAAARKLFRRDGKEPVAASVRRLPELVEILKSSAKGGRAAVYEGPLAEQMVETL